MRRRSPLTRKTPLRATGARRTPRAFAGEDRHISEPVATLTRQATLQRAAIKRRAPKKRAGHAPQYTAACKGECCYLSFPGCRSYPEDPTVVPAHQNEGKGMGLKVHDRFTVPACHFCHALYDQSGIAREVKRSTWDWAYTRWAPVRAKKLGEKDGIPSTASVDPMGKPKKVGIPTGGPREAAAIEFSEEQAHGQ